MEGFKTVGELIEKLKEYPEDTPIVRRMSSPGPSLHIRGMEIGTHRLTKHLPRLKEKTVITNADAWCLYLSRPVKLPDDLETEQCVVIC